VIIIFLFKIITSAIDIVETTAAVRNIRLYDIGEGKEPPLLLLTAFEGISR
jgi:hypothetical protein